MINSKNPTIIISSVEEAYGLSKGQLRSRKVSKFISKARREAITQLRDLGLTWADIGKHLNRDHSSVLKLVCVKPVHKSRKSVDKHVDKKGKKSG